MANAQNAPSLEPRKLALGCVFVSTFVLGHLSFLRPLSFKLRHSVAGKAWSSSYFIPLRSSENPRTYDAAAAPPRSALRRLALPGDELARLVGAVKPRRLRSRRGAGAQGSRRHCGPRRRFDAERFPARRCLECARAGV